MLFWVIVKVGLRSLMANKMRSLLAMLGIIIGVGAVISMLALGAGTKRQILGRISAMGSNLLVVRPGQTGTQGVRSGTSQTLTLLDAQAILAEVPGILRLAPVVNGSVQGKSGNLNTRTTATGTAMTYLPIRDMAVERGRAFNEIEAENQARVVIIGPVTATNLFDVNDPIGETVKVNGINFQVIGVLKAKGDQGFFNPDDQMIMPYSTAMNQLFGLDYLREIDIQAEEGADLTKIQADVTKLLRQRHRLTDDAEDDFSIRNQADIIQTVSDMTATFTIFLAGVGGISLLVGGIGIMNIMLVTVTERTREIGVRMAIGAKRRNIRMQFLVESIIISGLGGLLGVAAGFGGAQLFTRFSAFPAYVQPQSVVMSLSVATIVGVVFGFYPAWKASRLDPIEALRYE